MKEICVDSFAGGGGASLGIFWATGQEPDIAINHDPEAIRIHAINHPLTKHYTENVWKIKPREVTKGRPVGLAWFSPDCFPAGTTILTESGYVPIESVRVGDKVLTHKGRWRAVTSVMKSKKMVITIKGHGHPGLTVSSEHPFLASYRKNVWVDSQRRYMPEFFAPDWTKASKLIPITASSSPEAEGHYWATPVKFGPLPIPKIGKLDLALDEKDWWLVGLYLACGRIQIKDGLKAELAISCALKRARHMRQKLPLWPESRVGPGNALQWTERRVGSNVQFHTAHVNLILWLMAHFGNLSHEKKIPGWVYGAEESHRRALLDGCLAGHEFDDRDSWSVSSSSRGLVFGIKSLASSLGQETSIKRVGSRTPWHVSCQIQRDWEHTSSWSDQLHKFAPIQQIDNSKRIMGVFNLSVEEDESYVADSIVVHNCTHFSRAKGGVPVKKEIRSLAWVVIRWAKEVSPRVIILENVKEFQDYGPLIPRKVNGRIQRYPDGSPMLYPDPSRSGHSFNRWVGRLRGLGYEVQWRILNAADYGAATKRFRLFLVARNDGEPIVWPEATHHSPKKIKDGQTPWDIAANHIDWSIPCHSIFLTNKEAKEFKVKRPLAEKTMHRIAMGIKKYVLDNPQPFLVQINHGEDGSFRGQDLLSPLSTITGSRGEGIVTPYLARLGQTGGNGSYTQPLQVPLNTITSKNEHLFVSPQIVKFRGSSPGSGIDEPMPVITSGHGAKRPAGAAHSLGLMAATMVQTGYSEREGQSPRCLDIEQPLGTVVGNPKHALVSAFLAKYFGGVVGHGVDRPASTITAQDHHALAAVNLIHFNHGDKQWDSVEDPLRVITTCNHAYLVYSFLTKYFGKSIGSNLLEPLPTVTGKSRFGLVTVIINGETWVMVDILLRMLVPRELASCQGFPRTYILTGSNSSQVARIGNSVAPHNAMAIAKANYKPRNV